jgi:outer membrane lipoprotein carrier protein
LKIQFFLFLTLLTQSLGFAVIADENTDAAVTLAANLRGMNSIQAEFQQNILDKDGAVLQEAHGIVKIKRPQQFYWLTESPYEHLVVTDGSILWLHDIDLEQVSKKPFSSDEDSAPALLLNGDVEKLSQQYTIRMEVYADVSRYQLEAIDSGSLFVGLSISFDAGTLISMSFDDSFEQTTEIGFSNVVINSDLSDDLFQFVPPSGVDILDETMNGLIENSQMENGINSRNNPQSSSTQ